MSLLKMERGRIYQEGQKKLFVSADYPYYRDKRKNWRENLKSIKELGFGIVSTYVPWRHHQVNQGDQKYFTFDSTERDNADLNGFLEAAADLALEVFLKPGPFIHGEVKAGGIPDHMLPSKNPRISPMLDYQMKSVEYMGDPLPAPFNPVFLNGAKNWFRSLLGFLKDKNHLHPRGPVIGFQIGNEGVYSDANRSLLGYDFSIESMALFQEFLYEKYLGKKQPGDDYQTFMESPEAYLKAIKEISKPQQVVLDWGEYQGFYMNAFHQSFVQELPPEALVLCNINPPALPKNFDGARGKELDHWIARNAPESLKWVNYGFSNWSGNALERQESFYRLVFMSKLSQGPNLEDNWGHVWAGEAYRDCFTPLFHAILMLAGGATGFNVYNAVKTADWDADLEFDPEAINTDFLKVLVGRPNCQGAPIQGEGSKTLKFRELAFFMNFLNSEMSELAECVHESKTALAYHQKTHIRTAFGNSKDQGKGGLFWEAFCQLSSANVPFDIINLEHVREASMNSYDQVLVPEELDPEEMLRQMEKVIQEHSSGSFQRKDEGFSATHVNKVTGIKFHFFLNRQSVPTEFALLAEKVWIHLHPYSFGILKTRNGHLESLYIKARNQYSRDINSLDIQVGDFWVTTGEACDLLLYKEDKDWKYETMTGENERGPIVNIQMRKLTQGKQESQAGAQYVKS